MLLILDFGSQYTSLIAKQIRSMGYYCEVMSWDASFDDIVACNPKGLILSGGPYSVYQSDSPAIDTRIYTLGIPILGVCYGMQLIAKDFGGVVATGAHEFGYTPIRLVACNLFRRLTVDGHIDVSLRMSHCDYVQHMPDNFFAVGFSENCPVAAFEHKELPIFGLQFHPEVSERDDIGKNILLSFVHDICHVNPTWRRGYILDLLVEEIRNQLGSEDHVLLALSGGVDSSVTAALLHRVIGNRLHCVFVDTGLLRDDESVEILKQFSDTEYNITYVDASPHFFSNLAGVEDPEQKRKIIGKTFIDVFEEEAKKLNATWLAQGTIYSDVIESSASGKLTHNIKSHHNVGGLPKMLNLQLIEPLRKLFKDEVRDLGLSLGLSSDFIYRHPFPGPGLGVRILGEITPEYAHILRQADAIFIKELRNSQWYHQVSQAFAVFMPVKSVSVKGDCRCYGYTIALRAVQSRDFMTGKIAQLPYDILERCATRIINEIPEVSRVVYDISDKPPSTIEWE